MKRHVAILLLLVVLLPMVACSNGKGEEAAIEDTIRGYVTNYNAGDFTKCLTYFTGYTDEEDAQAFLGSLRSMSGELVLKRVKDISTAGETATATAVFAIGAEEGTDELQLKKVGGQWKILWEQESLTGDAAAMRDAVAGYFAAYNAGDFAGCLTYLTGVGNEQDAMDSLSLVRECTGPITFKEISGSVNVVGETASAHVDYMLWSERFSRFMEFRKDAGAWKIAAGYPTSTTLQTVFPGTVAIATELSGLVEVKHCVLEGNDGAKAWLWRAWQVRNTGDQTLHLRIVLQCYTGDDTLRDQAEEWADPEPGQVEGNHSTSTEYPLGYGYDPSYYKLVIESRD